MARDGGIDWAFGEILAFGTLLAQGVTVRLSGQDSRRGTFVQRHSVVADEFITSGERKWGQRSAVTLLLPHAHDGQGPDHTSGRPERWLQQAAEDNLRLANPTTPANFFHLLRRQALSPKRKPLIVLTPKSLLRHKECVSAVEDFTENGFRPVIGDDTVDPAAVKRVLLCTGKVYYDLAQARAEREVTDTALVRMEQLYPLPVEEVRASLASFPQAEDIAWVQEEPANQGAWSFMALNLLENLDGVRLRRISRPAAAASAVGSPRTHEMEQNALIEAALPRTAAARSS
jgi:multifunctional 2-oxoglutarate metabolism enzyme